MFSSPFFLRQFMENLKDEFIEYKDISETKILIIEEKIEEFEGDFNLEGVLTKGNTAGTNDIDMNNNDILQVNNIDLTTINGNAYPPEIGRAHV